MLQSWFPWQYSLIFGLEVWTNAETIWFWVSCPKMEVYCGRHCLLCPEYRAEKFGGLVWYAIICNIILKKSRKSAKTFNWKCDYRTSGDGGDTTCKRIRRTSFLTSQSIHIELFDPLWKFSPSEPFPTFDRITGSNAPTCHHKVAFVKILLTCGDWDVCKDPFWNRPSLNFCVLSKCKHYRKFFKANNALRK